MNKTKLLVERIRVSVDASDEMIANKAKEKMKRAGLNTSTLHFRLYKKSIDARNREDIRFECAVLVEGELPPKALEAGFLSRAQARVITEEEPKLSFGSQTISAPPMVVGIFSKTLCVKHG